MDIRPIKLQDVKAVCRVYVKSWQSAYKNILPQTYLDSLSETNWSENLFAEGRCSLVMTEGDTVIGTCSYTKTSKDDGEIISLYFLPQYCGKGYGGLLARAAIEKLKAMGCRKIFLWVLEENFRARRFYEKNGFSAGETKDFTVGGKKFLLVRYDCSLRE